MSVLCSYFQDDLGVTAIEYALIALLIAVVIVGAVTAVGIKLSPIFSSVAAKL